MTGERRYHLTLEEQCRMFRLLATMMGAAIGLSESFFLLESGEDSPRRSYVFLKIHIHLSQGHSLSSSLAKASNSFSPKVIAMIRLGEETGALARCIEALAADLEAEWNAVRDVRASLVYPLSVAMIALAAFGGLFAFLLPRMFELLRSLNAPIPPLLNLGLLSYDFLFHPLTLFALSQLALGVYLMFRKLRSRSDFELKRDQLLLELPLVGSLSLQVNAFRFASGLATMLRAGCPVLRGVKLLIPGITNRYLAHLAGLTLRDIREEGSSVSEAMRARGLFTPPFHFMLHSGEESGKTEEVLRVIASFYKSRYEETLLVIVSLLEPAVLLCLGFAVGFLALGFFLPLMNVIGRI